MQTSPTPAEPPDAQQTGQNLVAFPRSPEARAGHRLRALVVDDSPTVRQQMLAALTRMGMVCELASSGPEAMARLAEGHFDITLVDVMMPDMDGYRLTREIKRNKHLSDMPVIILTSRSSPFDLARGALAGCDAYLKKPVPLRQLESALVKALRRSLAIDDIGSLLRLSSANPAPDTVPRRKSALSS